MKLNNFEAKITIFANEDLIQWIVKSISNKVIDKDKYAFYIERPLTKREIEVLKLVIEGKSNTEIGNELNISSHTVKAHVSRIFDKLCVHDRIQAAVKATKENLI